MALFVLVTVGFAFFRHAAFFICNDSPGIYTTEHSGIAGLTGFLNSLGPVLAEAFHFEEGSDYRPLVTVFYWFNHQVLYVPDGPSYLHLLLIGGIYGGLAVTVQVVARRFVRSEAAAYFAVLLVLASPPLAATTWVFMVGVQAIVPLLICLGLLCYWKACEASRGRWFFLGCLGVLLLIGPWFREFLGIVPILIGLLELRRARRPTPLLALAFAALLHAVYPMALVKLLFLHDLPLRSVFALGNLGSAMGNRDIRWFAGAHFLPLFPPLLLVLGAAAGLAGSWERVRAFRRAAPGTPSRRTLLPALAFAGWLGVVLGLGASGLDPWLLPVALCLGVAVIGLQQDLFLPVWFLGSFVPMLRVFTEHIHFLYAVVPAAIILAGAAESLWVRAAALRGPAAWLRPALAACLAVVATDQAVTLYGVYRVNVDTYSGIDRVARWFRGHVPAGSAVVSNGFQGEEVKWHSGWHVEHLFTKPGALRDVPCVADPAQMKAFLARSAGKQVYLLDIDFDYLPWKAEYHQHRFVHQWELPHEDLGVVQRTRARYFFVDPLRYLVPRDYVPFLGAPDLVDEFYYGSEQDGRPFAYEVGATYHVYRVTGDTIRPAASAGPPEPRLLRSLAGYNLVAYRGWFYGIPQVLGPMDLQQTDVARMPGVIRDLSATAVESEIRRATAAP